MIMEYRFTINDAIGSFDRKFKDKFGNVTFTTYDVSKLVTKWLSSNINLGLIETILRTIIQDPPTDKELRGLVLQHFNHKKTYSSFACVDAYYEINKVIGYTTQSIDISQEEAKLLLESGITKVNYRKNFIDFTTILNEKEIWEAVERFDQR